MVKYWRLNGIRIIMFLDDELGTNMDLSSTSADATFVKESLLEGLFRYQRKEVSMGTCSKH